MREKTTGELKEEVFGCGEGGHAGGRSEGRRECLLPCGDPLWESRKKKISVSH